MPDTPSAPAAATSAAPQTIDRLPATPVLPLPPIPLPKSIRFGLQLALFFFKRKLNATELALIAQVLGIDPDAGVSPDDLATIVTLLHKLHL